jgi:adenylate cyclase
LGKTVNTASRMESSGEVGRVNISEATYELLKDSEGNRTVNASTTLNDNGQFTFTSRGKIEAKGKGEMEMYFVDMAG